MYRKADRERLERMAQTVNLIHHGFSDLWPRLKALSDGQDKLIQSQAALDAEMVGLRKQGHFELMGEVGRLRELIAKPNGHISSKSKAAKR